MRAMMDIASINDALLVTVARAKYDRKSLSPRRNFTLFLIYFLVLHHFHIIHGTLQYEMQFFSNVLYDTFFQCQHYLPTWLPFSTWSPNPLYLQVTHQTVLKHEKYVKSSSRCARMQVHRYSSDLVYDLLHDYGIYDYTTNDQDLLAL